MRRLLPEVSWMLADGSRRSLGREFVPLLAAIAAHGSLAAAARALALSYRGAWGMIEAAERATGARFVVLERGRGARLARAGERLVAADAGVRELLGTNVAALIVPLREPGRHPSPTVRLRIAASHDMVLAALREAWRTRHGVDVGFHGSAEALALYAAGSVDVAGFHVGASDRMLLAMLRPTRDVLLRFLRRSQGLILPRGNPKRVKTLADVARRNLRFVNRQPGSGTRILLDRLLAERRAAAGRRRRLRQRGVHARRGGGDGGRGQGRRRRRPRGRGARVRPRVRAAGRRGLPLRLSPPRTALAGDHGVPGAHRRRGNPRRGCATSPATPWTTPAPSAASGGAPTARSRCCRRDGVSATGPTERDGPPSANTGARSAKVLQ